MTTRLNAILARLATTTSDPKWITEELTLLKAELAAAPTGIAGVLARIMPTKREMLSAQIFPGVLAQAGYFDSNKIIHMVDLSLQATDVLIKRAAVPETMGRNNPMAAASRLTTAQLAAIIAAKDSAS